MLRDLDQQMEKRADDGCTLWIKLYSKYEYEILYHPGKANVVTDALSRKERVKPRRVRAMAMTIQYGVRGMILAAQSEAFKQENGMMRTVVMDEAHASSLRYLSENEIESPWILSVNFQDNSKEWNSSDDQLRFKWMVYLVVLADDAESVRDAIRSEYCLTSSSGWIKSPVLWAEVRESSLIGPELVQETTDKVVLIKEKLKAARDRQKRCADNRCKPLEFEVGDRVMLKVSHWKGVIRFGKKGKLAPRFLTSLLDDGRGSGSWMFLFVWSGYAAMRTLLWAGKVVSRSGYHQKDRKPSQNDKTEHGMEKTVQNQGQSPKMPKSESIQKEISSSNRDKPGLKNTIGCNLIPSDWVGKALIVYR
ncbi:hypothetical protein Tco_0280718 [Tanacetum coccineum]